MLDALRKRSSGLLAKILFGVLVAAFAVFGINGNIFTGSGSTVARVGSEPITADEFAVRYRLYLDDAFRRYGVSTAAEAEQLYGLLTNGQMTMTDIVLQDLVRTAVLESEARRLGLGISREGLSPAIQADPQFQDQTGRYSLAIVQGYIAQFYGNEAAFLEAYTPAAIRAQLVQAVSQPTAPLPNAYRVALHEYETEQRSVLYLNLTEPALGELPAPTEEQIQAQYNLDTTAWNAPETRTAVVLTLSPAVLADAAAITEEELRTAYTLRLADLGTPERRRIEWQVGLAPDRATAIQAQLDAGQTFEQLLAAGQITPVAVDPEPVGIEFFADPAIGTAAFALEVGGTTLVTGRFGATLVHVAEVVPGAVPPFEEVVDDLRETLANDRAAPQIAALREQVETGRDASRTLEEIAAMLGLTARTVTVDNVGNDPAGEPVPDLVGGTTLVTAIFNSDIGLEEPAIALGGSTYVWFEVREINAPHLRPIEEVRDDVIAAWRTTEVAARLQAMADAVLVRLTTGEPLFAIASGLGVELRTRDGLTRGATADEDFSTNAIQAAFNGPVGHVTTAANADGDGVLVLQVVRSEVPTVAGEMEEQRVAAFAGNLAATMEQAYMAEVGARTQISNPNLSLIRQITGLGGL